MVFYHVVRCGSFCCVPQLGALFGGHLGTTPTSQRAAGEREAGYLKAEWALFGGSLGTLPTSPRAMGEREANYLETEWALLGGSLGTLPTSTIASAMVFLPWCSEFAMVACSGRARGELLGDGVCSLLGVPRYATDVPACDGEAIASAMVALPWCSEFAMMACSGRVRGELLEDGVHAVVCGCVCV